MLPCKSLVNIMILRKWLTIILILACTNYGYPKLFNHNLLKVVPTKIDFQLPSNIIRNNEYKIGWLNPEILIIDQQGLDYSYSFNSITKTFDTCWDTYEQEFTKVATTNIDHNLNINFIKHRNSIKINNHTLRINSPIVGYDINPMNNEIIALSTIDNEILIYNYKTKVLIQSLYLDTNKTFQIKWNTSSESLAAISAIVQTYSPRVYKIQIFNIFKIKTHKKLKTKKRKSSQKTKKESTPKKRWFNSWSPWKKAFSTICCATITIAGLYLYKKYCK